MTVDRLININNVQNIILLLSFFIFVAMAPFFYSGIRST